MKAFGGKSEGKTIQKTKKNAKTLTRISFDRTPYSMTSLFSEFFMEFSGVILGVCETTWGLFGGHCEGVLKEIRGENYSKNKKTAKPLFTTIYLFSSR